MNRLGQKIKQLRLQVGMRQGELAKGLVTASMISQIEAGKANPSHKLLEQLAERLGTSVDYFLSDIQYKQEQSSTYKLAKSYIDHADYQKALILLQELAKQDEFFINTAVFLDLAECYCKLNQSNKALELYQTLYEKGLQHINHELAVLALNKQALIFYERQQHTIAKWYWEQAYSLAQRSFTISDGLFAQIQLNLGTVHGILGQHAASESFYLGAYELFRGTSHIEQIGEACMGLGLAYKNMENYQLACEFTQDAVTIYRSLNIKDIEMHARINLALIKRDNNQISESIEILNYCISEYARLDRLPDLINAKVELARTHISNRNSNNFHMWKVHMETAKTICEEALQLAEESSLQQADIFEVLGDINNLNQQYSEAVDLYKKSIQIFFLHQRVPSLLRVYTSLSKLNREYGEYKDATETYIKMEQMIQSILDQRIPLEIE